MADEAIKIKISGSGNVETAKGIDGIIAGLKKWQAQQEQLTKAQKDSAASTTANAEAFKRFQAAASEAANNNGKLAQSMQAANAQLNEFGEGTNKIRAKSAAAAALVGNLGSSFATLAPEIAGATTAIQRAGMAAGQMLGILGGGPGVLIGGLVAAVGALAAYMANSAKEADELAKATEANAKAMGSYLDQLTKLRGEVTAARQQKQGEADLQSTLNQNKGTTAQYQDEIETLQKRLGNSYYAQSTMESLASTGTNRDEIVKRQAGRRYIEEQLRQRQAGLAYAQSQDAAAREQAAGNRSAGLDFAAADVPDAKEKPFRYDPMNVRDALDKIAAINREYDDRIAEYDKQIALNTADEWIKLQQSKYDEEQKFRDESYQAQIEANHREAQAHADHMAELAQQRKLYQDGVMQGSQILASTAIKSFQMIAKGQKVELGAVLEGIGDQIVAMGTGYIFKGIAESILLNPQGPALIGVGTGAVAFGIGLGAVGARSPGGSTSGSTTNGAQNPFGPRDASLGPTSNAPGGPTVVNITMPTVISPTPEDGLRIREAVRQADNVYGR